MMTTTGDPRALALDVSPLGGAEHPRGIHCLTIVARHALSPSTPRAYGATLRASGVDRSARPSKEGYHAMNADTRLALFNRTYDVLNKGNCPIENAAKKTPRKNVGSRGMVGLVGSQQPHSRRCQFFNKKQISSPVPPAA